MFVEANSFIVPCVALYNWLPLTASVEVAETSPGATFVIVRSLPLEPTLTVLGRSATEP